ncbi:MAG TPA: hypothetical protein DEH78_00785 [Solibacterales bacterium]|nr:hypothetical protein [Bryobacterales bacterium]
MVSCTIAPTEDCLLSIVGEVRQVGNCVVCSQIVRWLKAGHRWVLLREGAAGDLSAALLSGASEYPSEEQAAGSLIFMRLTPETLNDVRSCINLAVQNLERVTIDGCDLEFSSVARTPAVH